MFSSTELCAFLTSLDIAHRAIGPVNQVSGIAPIQQSTVADLVWSKSPALCLNDIAAPIILMPRVQPENQLDPMGKTLIFVDNPRHVFQSVLSGMFSDLCRAATGKDDPALFQETATGHIGINVHIATGTKLGRNVVLHPGVVIYPNVVIEDNVEIGPGSIIGAQGYSYVRDPDGTLKHIPHIGGVHIAQNVSIGANTCVDSGGLGPTKINAGTKISNHCQIAHNVEIGHDCIIAGCVQVGGGTTVGDRTEIWPSTVISNNLQIGHECDIKLGSVVVTNQPNGSCVSGNFAVPHKKTLQEFAKRRW